MLKLFLPLFLFFSAQAQAGVYVSPYLSVSGTKAISKKKNADGVETVTKKDISEKGIRAGFSFWRLCNLALSVGQRSLTTSTFDNQVKDQWGELDFAKELDPNAANSEGYEIKTKDTQNRANLSFMLDPSFSIFIMRTKIGVSAQQRIVEVFENDVLKSQLKPAITYKPTAGAGFGVRLSPRMFALAEYSFYFYKFPKTEPFERELSVSFGLSI